MNRKNSIGNQTLFISILLGGILPSLCFAQLSISSLGTSYTIDFDNQPRKFDLLFESCGINVLVDKKSHLYIKETTIGWSNELQDKGFKFDNPHAKGACGCRTSFQIDMELINKDKKKTPSWME